MRATALVCRRRCGPRGCRAQAQTCIVAPETTRRIEALLCGSASVPAKYRFDGERCVEPALLQRFEDRSARVAMLAACGRPDLAEEMRQAVDGAASGFLSVLVTCVDRPSTRRRSSGSPRNPSGSVPLTMAVRPRTVG